MRLSKTISISMAAVLIALPVFAAETSSAGPQQAKDAVMFAKKSPETAAGDQELSSKHTEFTQFVQRKIKELNRNHKLSRSRMQVAKQADGSWQALYHEIDDSSLSAKVRRSQSKSIPFVGVLSYQEKVYAARSSRPDQFDTAAFEVVKIIPNRHIFSFNKGSWQ